MRPNRSAKACIINISSTSGMYGTPKLATYCMAKWGVRGLTKTLAQELKGTGIVVNTVCPTKVKTPAAPQGMAGSFAILGNTAQLPPDGLSTAPADLRAKSRRKRRLRSEAPRCGSVCGTASALPKCSIRHPSIICAFGLAAAAPRSPYRHLELCGIALV